MRGSFLQCTASRENCYPQNCKRNVFATLLHVVDRIFHTCPKCRWAGLNRSRAYVMGKADFRQKKDSLVLTTPPLRGTQQRGRTFWTGKLNDRHLCNCDWISLNARDDAKGFDTTRMEFSESMCALWYIPYTIVRKTTSAEAKNRIGCFFILRYPLNM